MLDEVHRLTNPSELLKIAADHYPTVRVLATGSSTLGASGKFRDTLAGRKVDLRLTPMIVSDLRDFGDPRTGKIDMVDWIESIPIGETRNYVQRVLENLQVYRGKTGRSSAFWLASDLTR